MQECFISLYIVRMEIIFSSRIWSEYEEYKLKQKLPVSEFMSKHILQSKKCLWVGSA